MEKIIEEHNYHHTVSLYIRRGISPWSIGIGQHTCHKYDITLLLVALVDFHYEFLIEWEKKSVIVLNSPIPYIIFTLHGNTDTNIGLFIPRISSI